MIYDPRLSRAPIRLLLERRQKTFKVVFKLGLESHSLRFK